jgi:AraC-like DNA-binding protein
MEATDLRPMAMSYFQLLARHFGDTGTHRAAILEGTGVSDLDLADAGAEINFAQQVRQVENLNGLFGEGWVLETHELWRPSSHGVLGVAAMSAGTVGAALEILTRYVEARSPRLRFKLVEKPGVLILQHRIAVQLTVSQWRPIIEIDFMAVRAILAELLGASLAGLRFQFTCPEPGYAAKLAEVLGGAIEYGAAANAVLVPREFLDIRSPLADAGLNQYATRQLDHALHNAAAPTGVKHRVERILSLSDSGRMPSQRAAETLGLSQRTLVRRLDDAGVRYRDLVEAELRRRAERLLEAGVLSKAEISERLGFADPTGFSRACRRWFR